MNQEREISECHKQRLKMISLVLKTIRFVDGGTQSDYEEVGLSRRQIQHGELGANISLLKLFTLLDAYGYSFQEFSDLINDRYS